MAESTALLIVGSVVKGATSALVSKYVEKVVNPFLRSLSNLKVQAAIKKNLFRYIKSVEYRTRTLPSIAIPSGVFLLDDVYEPVSVRSENDGSPFKIEEYPRKLFEHSRCIALTDDAGMGKSTLAKFIVRAAIKEDRAIPLLVELRRMRAGATILDSLCQELAGDSATSVAGLELCGLFANGNFVFVFDGYDELEDEVRSQITDEINFLAAKFNFCYFLLTSRKEYGSALFPEFSHFDICKLDKHQAHSLIRRYDQGRGLAKALIGKIEEADIADFLGNPLLVTLLYKAFDYRPAIPPKRGIFFRQVYEALFQDHDLSKGASYERRKQCGLDVDDFHKFMRALGFITFKSGRVSYSSEEFCQHLEAAVERSSLTVDWQKVKMDLIRAVPIFAKDGVEYRWSHKSFQEYFAASYITTDLAAKREEAISKLFNSEQVIRFREVLRFVAESDIALIRDVCIEPLLAPFFSVGGGDDDFAERVIFEAADVFYVGYLGDDFKYANARVSLQEIVREEFGIETAERFTRSYSTRSDAYGVLMALKPLGSRLVLLPILDPELFPGAKRFEDARLFQRWHLMYESEIIHINSSLSEQRAAAPPPDGIRLLATSLQVPYVTNFAFNRVREGKAKRREAIESLSVLDGF